MSKKIYYIIKSELHYFPPCMSQIRMLKKLGLDIVVIYGSSNQSALNVLKDDNIPYICIGEQRGKYKGKLDKVNNWLYFRKQFKIFSKKIQKDAFLWFGNAESALPLVGLIKNEYCISFLELMDEFRLKIFMFKPLVKKAKFITVCEETRGILMKFWWKLNYMPYVFPNKPFNLDRQHNQRGKIIQSQTAIDQIKNKDFIIYQGIFQNFSYLSEIAKALNQLNSNLYLVLMGIDRDNIYDKVKNIYNKTIYIPSIPAPHHLEITSHAKLGIAFYDMSSLNKIFCAPNKIYEYSGFGIPIICNEVMGLKNTVGRFNAGKCIDLNSKNIMFAIKEILDNYEVYSQNAENFYNYTDNFRTMKCLCIEEGLM